MDAAALRRWAVLGHPVAHSLSPALHQAAFAALGIEATYEAVDVEPGTLARRLEELARQGYEGLSVTSPLKREAFDAAIARTQEAEAAGVVNCLRRVGIGYQGTNTDGAGFVDFARDVGIELVGAQAVLLGGGGSAAGLAPALVAAGAQVISLVRRPSVARALPGLSRVRVLAWQGRDAGAALASCDLAINCTPLGRAPGDPLPCDPAVLGPRAVVVDLQYSPPRTEWLERAVASGRPGFNGLGLLVHQGERSLRYWLGTAPPMERLREAVGWEPAPIRPNAS